MSYTKKHECKNIIQKCFANNQSAIINWIWLSVPLSKSEAKKRYIAILAFAMVLLISAGETLPTMVEYLSIMQSKQ